MPSNRPMSRALRIANGRRSHDPLPPEDQAPRGAPPKPTNLTRRGSAIWDRIVKNIEGVGLLYVDDGESVAYLVEAIETYEEAKDAIYGNGGSPMERIVVDGAESRYLSPEYKAMTEASTRVLKGLAEFGLTPSSRVRLAIFQAKQKTNEPDVEGFIKNRGKRTG